ncbi:hypothetical protein BCR41DRAFT_400972 [Lobosporangium transversale]|uniref:Uncharacterized protein n=1 Tax=Lobosporangium transversale TaxID=64571 RepID=A0A1Y2GDE9_9FUNG|nr:hypothetical protein BCR41DRAFT_400972 [Lobosporangium transversale]ORZ04717.1 hypothetical protein BCR41DRAFT_400972 [Lobosporangium transversale]|eukprot:XP_021876714.1 hypothetical protein BCR41DRAFT_400972 [Lobosporangium transversale]
MWLLLATAIVAFLLVLFVLPETYRHHIDEPTTMTEESDNSQTNQSDITHVAGKLSLHSETDEPSSTPTSSPATRCTPSLKSGEECAYLKMVVIRDFKKSINCMLKYLSLTAIMRGVFDRVATGARNISGL